jgi:4-hydroxyphenylacetate 3-monooxygenase
MAARSGSEFLERLSAARVHVEIQGQTLTGGVADHPAFRNVVRSYADLYDMQHDPAFRDILTYPSPTTGEPVATAFLAPQTPADLAKRRRAFKVWADRSLGMLGRTGDYLNSALMALASAEGWFSQAGPGFGENIRHYYEKVREEDLLCTHTLIPPQANRAVSGSQQAGGALMAHIVREDDNGIVVRGARMLATIGPFADELLVFPSTVLRNTPEDKQYSFACAIPNDADGLRYLAREPLDYGRPRPDHPLGSRFEETDAVVIFDDVHVPYERCFVLGAPELCNGFYSHTSAVVHMTHQVVTRTTAKTEYILGLVSLLTAADVTGPAAADIETYLQSATLGGADRVKLFRLVWDTCISAFSGRQALYEYYFFGDPVRMAGAYVASYDREPYKAAVQAFLNRG